jgi:hypothetical protein
LLKTDRGKLVRANFLSFKKEKGGAWRPQRYRPRRYAHAGYDTDPDTRMRTILDFLDEKVN